MTPDEKKHLDEMSKLYEEEGKKPRHMDIPGLGRVPLTDDSERMVFRTVAGVKVGYPQGEIPLDRTGHRIGGTHAYPQGNDALRYDDDKLRYDLLPADAMEQLARVYTAGAKKYADRDWEKGMNWGRCFGSLMRHAWAFWKGEALDPETGCHHMAHVAWNALALVSYNRRGIGVDDRPLGGK